MAAVVLWLSLMGLLALLLSEWESGGALHQRQVGFTDPFGFLLGTAFVVVCAVIAALGLYTLWSFTEYRRLRDRIPDSRPPSPFTHPTRLVTILLGTYDLDPYGKRVRRTCVALLAALLLAGVLGEVLVV